MSTTADPSKLTPLKRWMIWLLVLGGLFLTAVIEATAFLPALCAGLSFVGLLITGIAGLITKRYGAVKFCGSLFLLSLGVTVVGFFVLLQRQQGEQETADRLVAAIDQFHKAKGSYPASLDALVPAHLPALPPPRWGVSTSPYFYRCQSNEFRLSYLIGFNAFRVYNSTSRSWTNED